MERSVEDIKYIEPLNRYSQAVIYSGVAYLAGQVAADPGTDFRDQTGQVLTQIDTLLEKCGSDKTRLLTVAIFLKDLRDLPTFNTLWDAWIVPNRLPTRLPIEANLASQEYLVEIQVNAAIK